MATHKMTFTFEGGGVSINQSISKSATGAAVIDGETVADGQTDQVCNFDLDVSACTSFVIVSDQDITVETNAGDDDTLALKANEPYYWSTDALDSFALGTDVEYFKFTNASGSTATVYAAALFDPSP